jgi:hypothetical protein
MISSTYGELKYRDEFDCYYNRRRKRVRVASDVVIESGKAFFRVIPIKTVSGKTLPAQVQFAANAKVEIYPDKTPRRKTRSEIVEDRILEILEGRPLTTAEEIVDRFEETYQRRLSRGGTICIANRLVKRGELVLRNECPFRYRKPIDFHPGLAVVRYPFEGQIQGGWIDQVKFLRSAQTLTEVAIVRWIDRPDIETVMTDANLEVARFPLKREIENAKKRYHGEKLPGFQPIPWYLFAEIQVSKNVVTTKSLLGIAKHLGFVDEDEWNLHFRVRNRVLDYLNAHYPDWRQQAQTLRQTAV